VGVRRIIVVTGSRVRFSVVSASVCVCVCVCVCGCVWVWVLKEDDSGWWQGGVDGRVGWCVCVCVYVCIYMCARRMLVAVGRAAGQG